MKTGATNKKIRELISLVRDEQLIPRPEFQRRLVWTNRDKDRFIETVLLGLPFPEIYLADGDVDLTTGSGTQILVDGLQRVSTLVQYFEGDPELRLSSVLPYAALDEGAKRAFLQYDVAVRDIGTATKERLIEVFKRINATKYSLTDIEVNNALYAGALKQFASAIAEWMFFSDHGVFSAADYRRMGDLRFALSVVITMLDGYFNRDDAFETYLSRFNDDFDLAAEIRERIDRTVEFIEECGIPAGSRAWKKADLFTLMVEIDRCIHSGESTPSPGEVVYPLLFFYQEVDKGGAEQSELAAVYSRAAVQASNDRSNRLRRGLIIGGILESDQEDVVLARLKSEGLLRE